VISPSDPRRRVDDESQRRVPFRYGLNYLIDVERTIIVDVEATPARTYGEVAATSTMNERTGRRFNLKPKRLAAVVGAGIAPHIPVWI
jgi:hypothetical protein